MTTTDQDRTIEKLSHLLGGQSLAVEGVPGSDDVKVSLNVTNTMIVEADGRLRLRR